MAHSTRILPILGASVLAATLVAGAYVLSGPVPFIDRVTAQSSEELLREYAVKDRDFDGLTDWQETLYGTDPANPNSFRADLTDGDAVAQGLLTPESRIPSTTDAEDFPGTDPAAGSLTERFSEAFLGQYLATRGTAPPTEADLIAFVEDAMADLAQEAAANPRYAIQDTRVMPADTDAAYRSYAADAASALAENAVSADKEDLAYFAAAANDADAASLEKLEEISRAYREIASALIAVEVPQDIRESHVAVANALDGLGTASAHLSALETDPILAMLGIAEYQRYRTDLINAFVALNQGFAARGVVIAEDEAGYTYYAMGREANKATIAP